MNRSKREGLLITFEGTEGAGKSTLIEKIEKKLKREGVPTLRTREPGGSQISEKIRALLLYEEMSPWTELFLYEAARAEHLHEVLIPALREKKIVLCDRFTDSTLAYQGSGRNLPWKEIKALNTLVTRGIHPDLTFWLDLSPEEGLRRAKVITKFEREGVSFQKKVRAGYRKIEKEEPKRFHVLRSDRLNPEELFEKAWIQIERRLA